MSPIVTIFIYCVLAAMASMAGGWLPSLITLTHLRKQFIMSLVSGVMLGVALLHLLPHAYQSLKSMTWIGAAMLCGVLVMFFLLRVFHVHSHDSPDDDDHCHDHQHPHKNHAHEHGSNRRLSWVGLLVGLTVHSLLDGVALAASVVGEASHVDSATTLLGFGTFLAVFLHKPLDAIAITSLMRSSDSSDQSRAFVNVVFAMTCPAGALLFWLGASQIVAGSEFQNTLVGCALAFSAGFFLCIALSDLLPEVAFHSHDRGKLSAALLLGVALSIAIEMTHSHDHEHEVENVDDHHHNHSQESHKH